MKIRQFVLGTSALVGAVLLGGAFWALDRTVEQAVRANAARTSEGAARLTFSAMYQVMSRGWSRRQAEQFLQSTAEAGAGSGLAVQVFRGAAVEEEYGTIRQPAADADLRAVLAGGDARHVETAGAARHIFPLVADERCLRCHDNAAAGTVLGAVEVRQDYAGLLADARRDMLYLLLALLPLAGALAGGAIWLVSRRIENSVAGLQAEFDQVEAVADLRRVSLAEHRLGFDELDQLVTALGRMLKKLRQVAIDKEILSFEIGLLEKFVITSDVVRDWRDYVGRLLADINTVVPVPALFSLFKIDDELFDLEVFWLAPPDQSTQERMAHIIRANLANYAFFGETTTCNIHHHIARPEAPPPILGDAEMALRVKSFFVDKPQIGGIVGIGVQAETLENDTQLLVVESVLSTLLNVVGSVKAIYKYTRDLEYYATRDPLTDLFNQRMFWELATYEIGRAQRHGYSFGLLLVDLDNFKLINDNYGHTVGDAYLQFFARQLRNALREGDICARYGGDEFVVVLPEVGLTEVVAAAERLRAAIAALEVPVADGEVLRGTASIGLAVYPQHAESAKDLLLFADNMMYRAKAAGKAQVAVPSQQDVLAVFQDITQRGVMVMEALEARRIIPFFQPILDIHRQTVVAYEVLSRIELDGQVVRADEFVEIAEKIGAIHRMDMLVIEQALTRLQTAGHAGEVFLNLSPRAMVLNEFARDLRAIVARSGFPPARIVFEITERDTVKNMSLLETFLNDLKADGFKLAIDDFGSGFSSFHYLRRFPIDYLKIEGDFIANMMHSEKDRTFVNSIRSLAREMRIAVVAEYVESAEVLAELGRMEVQLAQGYHIGRPAREPLAAPWRTLSAGE